MSKILEVPINRWRNKDVLCYNGVLLRQKIEWNLVICTIMDGPTMYSAKWNKSGREGQILYHFIYMWNLSKSKWLSITKQSQVYKEKPEGYHRRGA